MMSATPNEQQGGTGLFAVGVSLIRGPLSSSLLSAPGAERTDHLPQKSPARFSQGSQMLLRVRAWMQTAAGVK